MISYARIFLIVTFLITCRFAFSRPIATVRSRDRRAVLATRPAQVYASVRYARAAQVRRVRSRADGRVLRPGRVVRRVRRTMRCGAAVRTRVPRHVLAMPQRPFARDVRRKYDFSIMFLSRQSSVCQKTTVYGFSSISFRIFVK